MKQIRFALMLVACAGPAPALRAQASRLDSLDAYVKARMAERHISGLSLAIIQASRWREPTA
jgi:hypothetical protein